MDNKKLAIIFYRDFEREYFDVSENAYLDYSPWNRYQKYGAFPKVNFSKKDPICMISHKNSEHGKELWLYEKKNKFVFQELECIKNGFDHRPPLQLWTEYLKEPSFILYKIVGFGITKKYYLIYLEKKDYIYLGWTQDVKSATIFLYDTNVEWGEYHSDLVVDQKRS
jgi:hypothetical protein